MVTPKQRNEPVLTLQHCKRFNYKDNATYTKHIILLYIMNLFLFNVAKIPLVILI